MERLTPKTAEEFARGIFSKLKDKEEREFRLVHPVLVSETALILAKKINRKVNFDTLKIAAWVHDVGYSIEAKNHAEHSLKILNEKFDIDNVLKDCIINHGSEATPETDEGKIIQLADKAFILDRDLLRLVLKSSKEKADSEYIDFIKKMSEKVVDLLGKFDFS
jgi:HD superfamily phosphodiesterase